ncbi:MAG: SagB/ThcOx family dehydrogenase [Deltaproteobacteria bacterium]|nr:SagB/ThcOx family dehydrogenase [Deltaproteobacteria bacterium]
MKLPPPETNNKLDAALAARRSVREFAPRELTVDEISQLLWAGQGITSPNGYRTAPTAGGTLPLELHLLTGDGVFRYEPRDHAIEQLADDDRRKPLASACVNQRFIRLAPIVIVVGGVIERTACIYGERAERYVALEAGCASQSIMLEAVAMGLGSVMIGAYQQDVVARIAALPAGAIPFAVIPVGQPR